jgi:hypothetical protein
LAVVFYITCFENPCSKNILPTLWKKEWSGGKRIPGLRAERWIFFVQTLATPPVFYPHPGFPKVVRRKGKGGRSRDRRESKDFDPLNLSIRSPFPFLRAVVRRESNGDGAGGFPFLGPMRTFFHWKGPVWVELGKIGGGECVDPIAFYPAFRYTKRQLHGNDRRGT